MFFQSIYIYILILAYSDIYDKKPVNFIVVEWIELAHANESPFKLLGITRQYARCVKKVELMGKYVGYFISMLIDWGLDAKKIELEAFSLGVHIGKFGKYISII